MSSTSRAPTLNSRMTTPGSGSGWKRTSGNFYCRSRRHSCRSWSRLPTGGPSCSIAATTRAAGPMASIEKRTRNGRVVWRSHYRDPTGKQRNKSFPRKVDAERFLTGVESSKLVGAFIDPQLGRVTVGEWSRRWLAGQAHLKPTTAERYAGILREHITPRWSAVRLVDVSHA